jgi:hypothetical protein
VIERLIDAAQERRRVMMTVTVRRIAALLAVLGCLLVPRLAPAAAVPPPDVRHPDFPHVCDSGPKRGCACTPTDGDPNGDCSDLPFDQPVFENGPQCVPLILPAPKASGMLTYIIDEDVRDYDHPGHPFPTQAYAVLLEITTPDGRHLLGDIFQNLDDPTNTPAGMWKSGEGFGPMDEFAAGLFFGDPETVGIASFLRDMKPILYLAPEAVLADKLRSLLGAPAGSLPVVLNRIDDRKRARFEDQVFEPLASVVRFKVQIGFMPAAFGMCGNGIVEQPPTCEEPVPARFTEQCEVGNDAACPGQCVGCSCETASSGGLEDLTPCGTVGDTWTFDVATGSVVEISADTVDTATAADLCLSVSCPGVDGFGDDDVSCTFPPPDFACPHTVFTAPEAGSCMLGVQTCSTSCADAATARYRLRVTRDGTDAPLELTADDQ